MGLTQVRFAGFGGQGVIMMGMILGRAASIHNDMNATLTQSFGPEARGGACAAGVLLNEDPILYPYVVEADVLVAMSQEAYDKYVTNLKPDGVLLYEEELVELKDLPEGIKSYGIPATRIAEELGRKMVANMVMLGFMAAEVGSIPEDAVRRALKESVPKGTGLLNKNAFNKGFKYGKKIKGDEG